MRHGDPLRGPSALRARSAQWGRAGVPLRALAGPSRASARHSASPAPGRLLDSPGKYPRAQAGEQLAVFACHQTEQKGVV